MGSWEIVRGRARGIRFGRERLGKRKEQVQRSAGKIEHSRRLGWGTSQDESTHPTPDILRAEHLVPLSTSVSHTESMDGCGGRRSRNRAEQERDGGMDGCCWELHEVVSAQM